MMNLACFAMIGRPTSIFSLTVWQQKQMCKVIAGIVDKDIGSSFESIGTCWLSNNFFWQFNILTAAAMWSLWKEISVIIDKDIGSSFESIGTCRFGVQVQAVESSGNDVI